MFNLPSGYDTRGSMQRQFPAACPAISDKRFTGSDSGVQTLLANSSEYAELAHGNLVEAVRLQADWTTNGQSRLLEEILFAIGASRIPAAPFNAVIRAGNGPVGDQVLARARAVFAEHLRGFSVYVRETADRELEQQCRALGLLPSATMPVMVAFGPLHNYLCRGNLELEIVNHAVRVEHFVDIASKAFADTGLSTSVVSAAFGRPNRVIGSPAELGILRANGHAVACGALVYGAAVAGLYWVGTPPEFRGCGFASACTQLLTERALRNGCGSVVLQASPPAALLYRRLGFREVQRIRCYTWPFGIARQRNPQASGMATQIPGP